MMRIHQTVELSRNVNTDQLEKTLTMVVKRVDNLEKERGCYIDRSYSARGITVLYKDSQYKKKIQIITDVDILSKKDDGSIDELLHRLQKRIREYFNDQYRLSDFCITGAIFSMEMDVGNHESAVDYLKVLCRISDVKGFTLTGKDLFEGGGSLLWEGNSNGIDIFVYSLGYVDSHHNRETGKRMSGILRIEVHLTKPKAIRVYTKERVIYEQLADIVSERRKIFVDVIGRVIPFGDFYKKDKTLEIIQSRVKDLPLRRKMMQLVALIPEKKSLYLAQKSLNSRDIEPVMKAFAEINLSPVTISKRQNERHLKCLYKQILL